MSCKKSIKLILPIQVGFFVYQYAWEEQGIIGLCSKGVNKKCNEINKTDKYLNVLLTKQNSAGVNCVFCVVSNSMYTYTQVKDAFSYFYLKRKVLEDGVTTLPLDI